MSLEANQLASLSRMVEKAVDAAQTAAGEAAVQRQQLADMARRLDEARAEMTRSVEKLQEKIDALEARVRPVEAAKGAGAVSTQWITKFIFGGIGALTSLGLGLAGYLLQRSID